MRYHVRQSASLRLARRTLVLLLTFPAVPRANAQQTAIETVAVQLADAIAQSKQKTVAILDFSGPGDRVTTLGEKLADDLSAAMEKSGAKIHIENRSRVEKERRKNDHSLDIALDPQYALHFAEALRAKAFVMGAISLGPDNALNVTLNAYRTDNGKGIKAVKIWFPLSEEMAGLMANYVTTFNGSSDSAKYPNWGAPGYSPPSCIDCPKADYTREAAAERVEGVVELVAVVGVDGRLTDIRVVKGLPAGLTQQAIDTVKRWKLKPAIGPDGKPAAVRQTIEVVFRRQ
jgi:TonB family protein